MEYKRLTKRGLDWRSDVQSDDEQIYNRLAELEDKIENGTLIDLPCKVGDKEISMKKGESKVTLKNVALYNDKNGYYLSLEYEEETIDGIYRIEIPKADLRIPYNRCDIYVEPSRYLFIQDSDHYLCIGEGNKILLKPGLTGGKYSRTLIKKKTRKMTISEIEKELGYKVEVVSE